MVVQPESIVEIVVNADILLCQLQQEYALKTINALKDLHINLTEFADEQDILSTNEFKDAARTIKAAINKVDSQLSNLAVVNNNMLNKLEDLKARQNELKQRKLEEKEEVKQEEVKEELIRPSKILLKDGVRHLRIDELDELDTTFV
jgi:hypothetical protein